MERPVRLSDLLDQLMNAVCTNEAEYRAGRLTADELAESNGDVKRWFLQRHQEFMREKLDLLKRRHAQLSRDDFAWFLDERIKEFRELPVGATSDKEDND